MTPTDTLSSLSELRRGNRLAVALTLALAALVTGSAATWLATDSAADEAMSRARAELRAELGFSSAHVIGYLENVGRDLESIASSRIAASIAGEFVDAIAADGEGAYADIRRAYVSDNPNPPGRRQALLSASDGSLYSGVHSRYHDWLLKFSAAHDYHDLLLTDAEGNIVYSVFKEEDFGTSLVSGEYRETSLAKTFERVRARRTPGRAVFSDFAAYVPSGNRPAAFVGSPILRDGKFAGALLAQLKPSRLAALIGASEMSDDTRVYVVGADGRLRAGTDVPPDDVLRARFDTRTAEAALANRSGVMSAPGFRGGEVVSAYAPLRWSGVSWGLVTELDRARVERPVAELRRTLALATLLCTVLAFVAGWLLADRPERERLPQNAF